jgi:hypothetical protein
VFIYKYTHTFGSEFIQNTKCFCYKCECCIKFKYVHLREHSMFPLQRPIGECFIKYSFRTSQRTQCASVRCSSRWEKLRDKSLLSHRWDSSSIPGQSMWETWWTNWLWDKFLSESTSAFHFRFASSDGLQHHHHLYVALTRTKDQGSGKLRKNNTGKEIGENLIQM